MLKSVLSTAVLATTAVTPAMALDVTKTMDVAAPPATVWKSIGGFCGIGDWHPVIEKCDSSMQDGKAVRTLSLKGGGTIVELEQSRDDQNMAYTYTILSGPLPVSDYTSTLRVVPAKNGSSVTWSGHFSAKGAPDAKAVEAIQGVYDAGLKGIADNAR